MSGDPWAWTEAFSRTDRPRILCAGGCGYPVARPGEFCGECSCEEDSL